LNVFQAPHPAARPSTPQIIDIDHDSVSLIWLQTALYENPETFHGYQVQFREIGEPYWQVANSMPSFDSQYTGKIGFAFVV